MNFTVNLALGDDGLTNQNQVAEALRRIADELLLCTYPEMLDQHIVLGDNGDVGGWTVAE